MTPTTVATADFSPEQLARLHDVVEAALGRPLQETLRATLLSGGRSNLTYRISAGAESWVLRRPPLGHVLETAHDMSREYRVIAALQNTAVPVPGALCHVTDPSVIGAEFYLMDLIEGTVFRTEEDMRALSGSDAQRLGHAFVDAMADLHAVDYDAVGLGDFGRPEGYLERQVRRWTKQLAASASREVIGFAALADQLARRVPASGSSSIVHGDFRLDNAIVSAGDSSRILAILDWEMATLGDPLSDLGLFYLYWEGWRGLDNPIAATPADMPGFPSWSELADRYVARSGRPLTNFAWYEAFAIFKFAVICEGIHYRHVNGLTVGDGFDKIGAMVPELVQRGLSALNK